MHNDNVPPFFNGQNKDNHFLSEKKSFYKYLKSNIATASMVAAATGIPQKNICRYKRTLEKLDLLWVIEKSICQHTGFPAMYLTTNPKYKNNNPKYNDYERI